MSYCLNPICQKPQQNQIETIFCLRCGSKLLLRERYRAIKPIGQGGFGRTFLAVDEDKRWVVRDAQLLRFASLNLQGNGYAIAP